MLAERDGGLRSGPGQVVATNLLHMSHSASLRMEAPDLRSMLSKVPEVTLYFWLIKILCTTVGETAADYLNGSLGLGLTYASFLMTGLLVVALALQFAAPRYVPGVYWMAVVLISVVGTLVTDTLTDNFGVPLPVSTAVLALLLVVTFVAWYAEEQTLSIHTIFTRRRESFYWLAILLTFALGTAAGNLVAEQMRRGYGVAGVIFGAVIVAVAFAWWRLGLHPILAFWITYVLTQPLGASLGNLTSESPSNGGLGLGTTGTSTLFLVAILALVSFLSFTRWDSAGIPAASTERVDAT